MKPTAPAFGKAYKVDVRRYRDALRDAVELSVTTRGVLYILAQWMNTDGSNGRPSLERLAGSCQLGQRGLAKHLSAAVKAGYLHRTGTGHKGRTAVYQATIPEYRWNPETRKIVQPIPVVEPGQSMNEGSGYDAKGGTGGPQSLNCGSSKAEPQFSPTSKETSLLFQRSRGRAAVGSGPASAPGAAQQDPPTFDPFDDPTSWLDANLFGFEAGEEALVQSMLAADYHPHAIYNTVWKQRQAGA